MATRFNIVTVDWLSFIWQQGLCNNHGGLGCAARLRNAPTYAHFPALSLIIRFVGPTWGPSGADRTQVGPMLAPWTLLSGVFNDVCVIRLIVRPPSTADKDTQTAMRQLVRFVKAMQLYLITRYVSLYAVQSQCWIYISARYILSLTATCTFNIMYFTWNEIRA